MARYLRPFLLLTFVISVALGPAGTRAGVADGKIVVLDRDTSFVVAAPHGSFDQFTARIAHAVCEKKLWSCVIASRFRVQKAHYNVNRPTEGLGKERESAEARAVYQRYDSAISSVKDSKFNLLIELHGNARKESSAYIEVASLGVSLKKAKEMKRVFQEALIQSDLATYKARVEPMDKIFFTAGRSKRAGSLSTLR